MPPDPTRFSCSSSGCSRSYKKKEHLFRHMRDHVNLRPFTCPKCPATFNRNDLLRRHETISHGAVKKDEARLGIVNSGVDAGEEVHENQEACTDTDNSTSGSLFNKMLSELKMPSNPTTCLLDVPNRDQLQKQYFDKFHPHWPLIHKKSFIQRKQPPELVGAILTVGLSMSEGSDARREAQSYNDALLNALCLKLFKLVESPDKPVEPRAEFLPSLQILVLVLILATYRGVDAFPSCIVVAQFTFKLFKDAGVYDQKRIDAHNTCPVARESYQRLALLHFKAHIHLNFTLIAHSPQFQPFRYFRPDELNVQIPSPLEMWDGDDTSLKVQTRDTISSFFSMKADTLRLTRISSLVAWDFCLGMVVSSCLMSPPDEECGQLCRKVGSFLFSHTKEAQSPP